MPTKKSYDYTSEWVKLGYPRESGSASFLPPPANDFVRAYYMTPSIYAVSNIEAGRLKIARFADVNDPFELLGVNCHDPAMRKLTKKFREAQNQKKGLLSFGANWTSAVMWSHYADRHRGMSLGFDLRRDTVETVSYKDKRLRAQLPDDRDPDRVPKAIQEQWRRTKSHEWAYENERRVFIELATATLENGLYFAPFGDAMQLREVIIGPRCQDNLSVVRSLVAANHPRAVVFKARLAFQSFRVVLNKRTKPSIV